MNDQGRGCSESEGSREAEGTDLRDSDPQESGLGTIGLAPREAEKIQKTDASCKRLPARQLNSASKLFP